MIHYHGTPVTPREKLYGRRDSASESPWAPIRIEVDSDVLQNLMDKSAEVEQLRAALEQAQADLEEILPPRGHEELAQGVYFAYQRVEKALRAVRG